MAVPKRKVSRHVAACVVRTICSVSKHSMNAPTAVNLSGRTTCAPLAAITMAVK